MENNLFADNGIGNTYFQFLHTYNFLILALKFGINLIVISILTRLIYYKTSQNRIYMFTLFVFNITIFLVCSLLNNMTLSLGFSFGIFALFSVLRYRTITIPIKEMTYFFVAISIAIINAMINPGMSFVELIFTNTAILVVTYSLEKLWLRNEHMKYIIFEKIELVKPENHDRLLVDLKERTGLNIHRFEIGKIDFLRDIAELRVYYKSSPGSAFVSSENFNNEY